MVDWTKSDTFSEGEESNQVPKEAALVVHAQEGDKQAFEILWKRYHSKINRYLTRMVGDDSAGDELAQETFFNAWLKLPGLREPTRFISWLYTIARNRGLDYQRRRKRLPQIPLDIYIVGGDGDALSVEGPEEGVEQRELIELALNQVSPTYRSCLILYVIKGLSQREVAQRLNIKEASVGKQLSRGKEELRQIYLRLSGQRNVPMKRGRGEVDE